MINLICPSCKNNLTNFNFHIECGVCGQNYPIREGIPSFTKDDFYWNEIPRTDMQEILRITQQDGWQKAIYDVLNPVGTKVHATVGDERRADWKYYIPLSKESRALDLGCGWGATAIALSDYCGQVIAMDTTFERIHFLNLRRQQQNIKNVYPIHGGDTLSFPFPKNYFDLVTLVGVLEWLGESCPDLPPHKAQQKALLQIREHLKPDGYIYIGIENRFGFDYLMGRPDHNGVPFIGLLPRKIANWLSLHYTGKSYRTYQYSLKGYRKLLSLTGFYNIKFYGDLPQYRQPFLYIPLEDSSALKYFLSHLWNLFLYETTEHAGDYKFAYFFAKFFMHLLRYIPFSHLIRFIIPGYSILAQRK